MRKDSRKQRRAYSLLFARIAVWFLVFVLLGSSGVLVFLLKTQEHAFEEASRFTLQTQEVTEEEKKPEAFPLGVDPLREVIVEDPEVESFFETHITQTRSDSKKLSWLNKLTSKLALFSWYQNLASPTSRILVVDSGERKEEVASHFGQILRWDAQERALFLELVASSTPLLSEGKFYPGNYVTHADATPQEVAYLVTDRFESNIVSRYPEEIDEVVPLEDALIIASLLEREAYDFEDMRYISGVIWNRLFIDMNLQIDASLQYAKGTGSQTEWWPVVRPADKYIDSPFNTYEHAGLPPAPIANPSPEAILAALNPRKTDCLFYFHDKDGGFHCTKTYEEHVALLKQFYGRGQ